jgi:hypothetical protein
MKRAMFLLLAAALLAGSVGCVRQCGRRPLACMSGSCAQAPENCQSCDAGCDVSCDPGEDPGVPYKVRKHACRLRRAEEAPAEAPAAGPATGAITYPYYTTRGPRDFLAKNPPSIGP